MLIAGACNVYRLYSIADPSRISEGYITVEGNAGDRNNLSAWHGGVGANKVYESQFSDCHLDRTHLWSK